MPLTSLDSALVIFVGTIAATFLASYWGRRHSRRAAGGLADEKLNKWLVGLSAGATANSGFVVTGAVGLGYAYGAQWLLLPIAWLLGDMLFWSVFPHRINRVARETAAVTLTDVITADLPRRRLIKRFVGSIALICLGGYVAAQWVAGQKFLEGAFGFDAWLSLLAFAGLIILYSSIGGFRGSVYADSLQAIIRLIGTALAVIVIAVVATRQGTAFSENISAAGPSFLELAPSGGLTALLFVLGFAAAGLGFGLGQPQIVTRYMAGSSPSETRAAWWIYIGFVQSTWLAMTAFGVVLRGVMPDLADPETGLSAFFRSETGPILTGIIVADIFATIAAASNSLLIAMAQTAKHDLLLHDAERGEEGALLPLTLLLGGVTMVASAFASASVFELAISSVAFMGAGLAPAMIAKTLGWKRSAKSVVISIVVGILTAAAWKFIGYSSIVNEAAPGMALGLIAVRVLAPRHDAPEEPQLERAT